ncbi:MAG: hypothetical protein ACE5I4_07955, partial [Thermoplasmata archaeon]
RPGFPFYWYAECDMTFNDRYWWYSSLLLRIATHEAGHFVGLADLYNGDPEDDDEVMANGADLWWGDAMGVRHLYYYLRAPFTVGHSNQGLGAGIANLDYDSLGDVVLAWADNPWGENRIWWKVGRDISSTDGSIPSWGTTRQATFWIGAENSGVGSALGLVDSDSRSDLLVAWVEAPSGSDRIHYRIGWDISSYGYIGSWSSLKTMPGYIGSSTYGLGAALVNIGGSSRPDLVLSWMDSYSGYPRYRIGWDISTSGSASWWGSVVTIPWTSYGGYFGLGLDFGDIDQNGILDMVISYRWASIRIGWDIGTSGQVVGWSREFFVTWGPELPGDFGLGMAVYQFGTNPRLGMLVPGILGYVWGADSVRYIWA